jgi:hypothetical protein
VGGGRGRGRPLMANYKHQYHPPLPRLGSPCPKAVSGGPRLILKTPACEAWLNIVQEGA